MHHFSFIYGFHLILSITLIFPARISASQQVSQQALLGATLFSSTCVSCHGSYEQERVASEYKHKETLLAAIAKDACEIIWAKSSGGELRNREIESIAVYMLAWEKSDGKADFSGAPAPQLSISGFQHKKPNRITEKKQADNSILPADLTKLIEKNPVAKGGYLYTQNCYRCHLGYATARMGKDVSTEIIGRFIREGKISTQMKPFSRMLGGPLKNNEIDAIVTYITTWEKFGEPLAIADELLLPPKLSPDDFKPLRLPRFTFIKGDNDHGRVLYTRNCRRCHGSSGEGHYGPRLNMPDHSIRPDLYKKSVIKKGIPRSLMMPWELSAGGSLSAKDIEDLVSFVVQWSD